MSGDFPDGPVVKTSPSNAGVEGLIPSLGAKIPHVSWPKHQNIKHKLSLYKFKKDFKNDPHAKKKTKITLKKKGMSVKNNQPVSLCHTPAKQLWTHLLTSGDSCQ